MILATTPDHKALYQCLVAVQNFPVSYAPMLNLYHQVNKYPRTDMFARSEGFRDIVEGRHLGV